MSRKEKSPQPKRSAGVVKTLLCQCGCGQYFSAVVKGRPPAFAGPDHRRKEYARRKAAQRRADKAKENGTDGVTTSAAVFGYSKPITQSRSRQVEKILSEARQTAKKMARWETPAPLSLGRGFGGRATGGDPQGSIEYRLFDAVCRVSEWAIARMAAIRTQ